ncbi:carbohydrate ABC transporter permease [Exiguobacterium profundum]|uniref:Binding-protein-dependent transport systems inner membrane component n=1 Tax=Exiguobacterium sp. (strain ATCC BAA-1283 / AT1b) TaxID=360911 RepID=C4L1S2_EXISA|nr:MULTISPECIES: sugar ABC transporter permease [Exiguobacterium]MBG0918330.1 sugar ABC transporter permease [Exiguobacterium sp. SRB7LM]QPI67322.1 sugar ABC transporter permease [Exiguobacterium sp. PBE]ACQ71104.1 binding-protein-dependent transport systems inner membrane component [Exiguobacterium sp. AT1b]MCT4799514.1 sugar ABC transporter permease [Exiguobacterium profundum]MCV9901189.1 sugar ABC transporter permease [Exiguobacterium sp. N5]
MKKLDRYGYLFIAPFWVVFLTFSIYPVLLTLYYSFTNYTGSPGEEVVGFANYTRLLTDTYFIEAFFNTIKIWGINFVLQIGLALLLALIFSDLRLKLKGLSFFRSFFYLPNLITISSVALLFGILLDWQHGSLNMVLMKIGLISDPINWLAEPVTAQLSVSLILTWMWFGHSFIIVMAGVSGISTDYFEAAHIDGANRWQMFTKVTLPLLKPILLYIMITSLIGGLQLFDLPMLITDGIGSPDGSLNTMVLYLYNQAFKYNNYGYASAVAYGLFLITLIFSAVVFKGMFRKERATQKGA